MRCLALVAVALLAAGCSDAPSAPDPATSSSTSPTPSQAPAPPPLTETKTECQTITLSASVGTPAGSFGQSVDANLGERVDNLTGILVELAVAQSPSTGREGLLAELHDDVQPMGTAQRDARGIYVVRADPAEWSSGGLQMRLQAEDGALLADAEVEACRTFFLFGDPIAEYSAFDA